MYIYKKKKKKKKKKEDLLDHASKIAHFIELERQKHKKSNYESRFKFLGTDAFGLLRIIEWSEKARSEDEKGRLIDMLRMRGND